MLYILLGSLVLGGGGESRRGAAAKFLRNACRQPQPAKFLRNACLAATAKAAAAQPQNFCATHARQPQPAKFLRNACLAAAAKAAWHSPQNFCATLAKPAAACKISAQRMLGSHSRKISAQRLPSQPQHAKPPKPAATCQTSEASRNMPNLFAQRRMDSTQAQPSA